MTRRRKRVLSRYLLHQHVAPFWFAVTSLTALLLLNQIAKRFGQFIGKGLPWSVIAEFFALSIPFIIAMTLPMAVLVAVLFTWSRFAEGSEYTAFLASGVSPLRLVRPVALGGLVVTAVALAFTDQVLPRTNHRLRMLMVDIQRKKPNFALKEQVVNEVLAGKFFLRSGRIFTAPDRMRDVTIYDLESSERRRVIYADSGALAYSAGLSDLYLTLYSGVVHEFSRRDPGQFAQTYFETEAILLKDIVDTLRRTVNDNYRSDRELSICEMDERIARAEQTHAAASANLERQSRNALRRHVGLPPLAATPHPDRREPAWYCRIQASLVNAVLPPPAEAQSRPLQGAGVAESDLRALRQQVQAARRDTSRYAVEVHKKLAISVACLVFVVIGIPLALRFPRSGVGLVISASVVVFAAYYMGLIAGEDLADRGIVDPAAAMWMPNVLFAILGIMGLIALQRGAAATTRTAPSLPAGLARLLRR